MTKKLIFIIFTCLLNSCDKKSNFKNLAKFDENGNMIVYSEEVYAQLWTENRNLKVTVVDTFCSNQKTKATKDIKNGKLIYFGYHPRELKKMTVILNKFGIETKEHLRRGVRLGGFEPYCYEEQMNKEIVKKYGETFIDSIFKVAQMEYLIENPNVEYLENGINLRENVPL